MEAEEDYEGNADVGNDAPGPETVEMAVKRHRLGFLHFERVDDPQ